MFCNIICTCRLLFSAKILFTDLHLNYHIFFSNELWHIRSSKFDQSLGNKTQISLNAHVFLLYVKWASTFRHREKWNSASMCKMYGVCSIRSIFTCMSIFWQHSWTTVVCQHPLQKLEPTSKLAYLPCLQRQYLQSNTLLESK